MSLITWIREQTSYQWNCWRKLRLHPKTMRIRSQFGGSSGERTCSHLKGSLIFAMFFPQAPSSAMVREWQRLHLYALPRLLCCCSVYRNGEEDLHQWLVDSGSIRAVGSLRCHSYPYEEVLWFQDAYLTRFCLATLLKKLLHLSSA